MRNIKTKLLCSLSAVALMQQGDFIRPVAAQVAALEEIIVTARKREENLQDIPLAITAFDASTIARKNISELDDIARFTAGFAFEDANGALAQPVIRGQSQIRVNAREQVVATFIDGIYIPRQWIIDLGFANIERLEVVKGPQSSRYGRNAFAGALNYITKAPGDDYVAEGTLTYGSYDRFDGGARISIPLVEDVLAFSASFDHTEFDGSWRNDHPNANADINPGTTGRIGGWDNDSYSARLVVSPFEDLNLDLAYYRYEISEEATASKWLSSFAGEANCGNFLLGNFRLFCGTYGVEGNTAVLEPRGISRQSDTDIFRVNVDYDLTEAITFNYLFGRIEADGKNAASAETDPINCGGILGPPVFPPLCNFQGAPVGTVKYSSHEARIAYDDDGPIRAAFGGYYSLGRDTTASISANVPPGLTEPLALDPTVFSLFDNITFVREFTKTEVKAVFGEVEYSFLEDRARISAELRYTDERINTINLRNGDNFDSTFDFVTPRFTLEYDITEDSLFYGTVARGAKAGGFNAATVLAEDSVFDPEFNWTFELGSKNTLLDGRMVLNAAAYLTKWRNQQVNGRDPASTNPFSAVLTRNLGNSTIYGVEVEGSFQATENLGFDAAFSYIDSTFDSGVIDQVYARFLPPFTEPPCDDVVCRADGDIGGNDLPRSPDLQLALGVQWEDELPMWDGEYYIRGDVGYQSDYWAETVNISEMPSRAIVNGRIGMTFDHVDAAIWVRNLTDKKYVSSGSQIIQPFSRNLLGTYFGERRTFGATVTVSY